MAVAGVGVLGVAWIVATGVIAWAQLHGARDDVRKVEEALLSGHPGEAQRLAASLRTRAGSAHARTSGPAWWVAAHIPWVGSPFASWRQTSTALDALADHGLRPVVQASDELAPDKILASSSQLDLTPIRQVVGPLRRAQSAVDAISVQFDRTSRGTWFGPVDNLRDKLQRDLVRLRQGFSHAITAARIVPAMLGDNGPRRYFVGFENDAEARGLGGLPGAYGILLVDHGKFRFVRFGSDNDLAHARSTARMPASYNNWYGATFHASTDFRNSDASPHFPYVAATWVSMWENKFHQRLDGAMVTDPTALSYLMKATGPVTLSDGQKLVSDNVVQVLESSIYQKFPGLDQAAIQQRKDYLVAAAKTLVSSVTQHVSQDPTAMLEGLRRAAAERRLLIYSSHPAEERQLSRTPVAGELARTNDPFVGLVINNSSGSKLDYYLDQQLDYTRSTCAATTATVTVRLHNDAPASGLPPYVTYTTGLLRGAAGVNRDQVSLYMTHGAELQGVTLDGKKQFIQSGTELGHPVVAAPVTLLPGQTRELVFKVHEPAAQGPVQVPVQPLVRGLIAKVDAPVCTHA